MYWVCCLVFHKRSAKQKKLKRNKKRETVRKLEKGESKRNSKVNEIIVQKIVVFQKEVFEITTPPPPNKILTKILKNNKKLRNVHIMTRQLQLVSSKFAV